MQQRCAAAFADLGVEVQVRNQARVHLWYPQRFGVPCPPLENTRAGIDAFLQQSACFGVRREHDGSYDVYAPFGFTDLFDMVVRPNPVPHNVPRMYYEKAKRWSQVWPKLTVLPWPG